ncbi:MAG: 50S ribosomal protein L4 [Anaerolineae bacterium]
MQVPVYNQAGEEIGQIELRSDIFGITPNKSVMHQALVRQLANQRQGTADTKTRGEVSGGGRKPWKQKGTGRARQGSTRAPHWKGGGVVFGPHPRSYEQRMPKKMRRLALKSALSVKAAEDQIRVIDAFSFEKPRTREMDELLGSINCPTTALILLPKPEDNVMLAARNLEGVKTLRTSYLNVRDLIGYDYLVLTREALQAIEQFFGEPAQDEPETAGAPQAQGE